MIKCQVIKTICFAVLWIFVSAEDLKQCEDVSESMDIDFSFLENDPKHENWVDPFNMFEYKPSISNLKTVDNKDSGHIEKKTETANEEDDKVSEEIIAKKIHTGTQLVFDEAVKTDNPIEIHKSKDYQQELFDANIKAEANSCNDEEFIYLKRTANMILSKVETLKQDPLSSTLHVKLIISDEAIGTLKAFLGSPCKHFQEFDSVISVILNNAELTESYSYLAHIYSCIHRFFQSEAIIYCMTAFIVVIVLWGQLLRLSIRQIVARLIILTFILSFAWNWVLLFKVETANAHAKAEKAVYSECHNDKLGIYKKISVILSSMFFSSSDSCKQYYEAVLVEPIWKVSPLIVLSKTSSDLFFHPLGLLGQHLGSFFQNLFSAVSWYLLVPVTVIVTISILLLLLMVFGYRIKLPFLLCTIEPGHQQYTREQKQLISDVLEGRVHIQRTDSIQNINMSEKIAHCSNCSNANNVAQKTIEQGMRNATNDEDKRTQTNITEPGSLSSLCYDRLINSKLNGKIQDLEKITSSCLQEKN